MDMHIRKVVGRRGYTFTFHGEDLHEVVMQSQHLGFDDIHKCGLCGSDDLVLYALTTEGDGYQYVKVKCLACRGAVTFGKTKKDGTYYLRRQENSRELAWEAAPPRE